MSATFKFKNHGEVYEQGAEHAPFFSIGNQWFVDGHAYLDELLSLLGLVPSNWHRLESSAMVSTSIYILSVPRNEG